MRRDFLKLCGLAGLGLACTGGLMSLLRAATKGEVIRVAIAIARPETLGAAFAGVDKAFVLASLRPRQVETLRNVRVHVFMALLCGKPSFRLINHSCSYVLNFSGYLCQPCILG